MVKRNRGGPAPQPRTQGVPRFDDQSLIIRSAESLGRIIGALQRQLDAVARTKSVNGRNKSVNGRKAAVAIDGVKRNSGRVDGVKTTKRVGSAKTSTAVVRVKARGSKKSATAGSQRPKRTAKAKRRE